MHAFTAQFLPKKHCKMQMPTFVSTLDQSCRYFKTEKCICINNSDNHPRCDSPCFKMECPGGKCILDNEGNGKCVCRHESSLPTIYPSCQDSDECSKLRCEDQNGKCAYDENGQYRCICKNEYQNFPMCSKYEGCFPACEEDEVCVKSGNYTFNSNSQINLQLFRPYWHKNFKSSSLRFFPLSLIF